MPPVAPTANDALPSRPCAVPDTAPEEFDVHQEPYGDDGVIVAPRGELDIATAPQLRAALRRLEPPPSTLIIDFRELTFLDTSGLQLVLEERQRAADEDRRLILVRGSAELQRLFELAGLDEHLPFVDDPAEG
jgi:anti-sigma B factor antagonist